MVVQFVWDSRDAMCHLVRYFSCVCHQFLMKLFCFFRLLLTQHINDLVRDHAHRRLHSHDSLSFLHLSKHFKSKALALVVSIEVAKCQRVLQLQGWLINHRVFTLLIGRWNQELLVDKPVRKIIEFLGDVECWVHEWLCVSLVST